MEWIDVPIVRRITLLNGVKRELISRRNNGAARLTLREELLLGDFLRFRVMRDENYIDVVVRRAQKSHHPEIKAARDVFLELAHRAGDIDHGDDDGVRLVAHHLFPRLET